MSAIPAIGALCAPALCLRSSAIDPTPHSALLKTKAQPQFERPFKSLSTPLSYVFHGSNRDQFLARFLVFTVRSAEGRKTHPTPLPYPSQIGVGLAKVIPDHPNRGPVHARFSRGWAEIGLDFINQTLIGVGFSDQALIGVGSGFLVFSQEPRAKSQKPRGQKPRAKSQEPKAKGLFYPVARCSVFKELCCDTTP